MGGVTATHAFGRPLVPLAEVNQDKVTPGLLGFVIFAAIAFGLWMLMKNMGKQMKKIDFEEQPDVPEQPAVPRQPAAGKATAASASASAASSASAADSEAGRGA
ncbi:hypothetical protein OHA86_13360 [Streptomyces sp. NBC_01477]